MTDFFDAVDSRRSIRAFLPDPVPAEVLDRCLDAALKAPSTSNLQPWRFVLLQSPEARAGAVKVCLGQAPAASAPLLVALVCAPDSWRRNRDEVVRILAARGDLRKGLDTYYNRLIPLVYLHGPLNLLGWWKPAATWLTSFFRPFPTLLTRTGVRVGAQKTTALAAATFMLALRAEGFDSCPMEGFDNRRAAKLLGLKGEEEVCMFLAVGKRAPDGIRFERALLPRDWTVQTI
ncbi:nitroreductase family protein [Mesoterricola silvestris]|uniref:Nitroreductase n=1 Tax=Mesoterricola silvestris TaxID=2927979 RepID=A0AA48GPD2_9BACT|nr:nitroreductase family protein [Mesoterricola silvestris]BDU71537.1 nitroreductase [Mesoterricola silvestris]